MKFNEAEKIAEIIEKVFDQHNSMTATIKIRESVCGEFNSAFQEYFFQTDLSGRVSVEKFRRSSDSMGKSLHDN